jgi:hypothetical protein
MPFCDLSARLPDRWKLKGESKLADPQIGDAKVC